MFDQSPVVPGPSDFWATSIPVVNESFRTDLTSDYLFPGPDVDPAFKSFATLPYVQTPVAYYPKSTKQTDSLEKHETFCFASRSLDIPEYLKSPTDAVVNHKWDDFTIYEPDPMRMWRNWRSELSSNYPGVSGNIGSSIKLTIAPKALSILLAEANHRCSWPSVDSNDILFTFAGLDHDKVSEHGPVYGGVWLHREGDLILETPIESDQKIMSTTPGHGYMFREGRLVRIPTAKSCSCGKPESHDQRVFSVLQISRLVKDGRLIFLPHPSLSTLGWFVVISPGESSTLQPSVDSFHRVFRAILIDQGNKTSKMKADAKELMEATRSASEKAFGQAKAIGSDDDRWGLVVPHAKQASVGEMMPDELASAIIEGQAVIYVPESDSIRDRVPDVSILYLWPTVFGPIYTFSFYWKCGGSAQSFRTYWKPTDARIDCAKNAPMLFAFSSRDKTSITRLVEVDLRPVTNLPARTSLETPSIDDFEAARLWAMHNLNKPSAGSHRQHWLRHGFITRLAQEVDEAIRCITENDFVESIPEEAQRMKAQGLQDCYKSFPYHRDVYAFCKAQLSRQHDHFLRPFFEVLEVSTKAKAQRLGYQLQGLMTCALYSVTVTRSGTCIPSYGPEGLLDIVKLDLERLGHNAQHYWDNLPWTIIHFYRETIGAGGFPADIGTFYDKVPVWRGDLDEGNALARQLMAEAVAAKSTVIKDGEFFSIEDGGILTAVRLHEFGNEVLATFYGPFGGFVQASINPSSGEWKLNMQPSLSVKVGFDQMLEKDAVFEAAPDSERSSIYDERFNLWMRQIEVGMGVFLAKLIRDLWTRRRGETAFQQNSTVKRNIICKCRMF
jgi:hypothetical protein